MRQISFIHFIILFQLSSSLSSALIPLLSLMFKSYYQSNYGGTVPQVKPGALLAIPASVSIHPMSFILYSFSSLLCTFFCFCFFLFLFFLSFVDINNMGLQTQAGASLAWTFQVYFLYFSFDSLVISVYLYPFPSLPRIMVDI